MDKERPYNTLFDSSEMANIVSATPLAARMRPRKLDEFIGQRHFLGPDKLLTRMLEADRLSSLIFYGPPGVGKTSLAQVIANRTRARFHSLSAPAATVGHSPGNSRRPRQACRGRNQDRAFHR